MTDAPHAEGDSTPAVQAAGNTDDLLGIKQQALQQLSPLVGHLEQSPEEKFRTTMMMIQASDDQSLIKTAYEAAKEITDEKNPCPSPARRRQRNQLLHPAPSQRAVRLF